MRIFARSFLVRFSCILLLNALIVADHHHVIEGDKRLLPRSILNKNQEDGQEDKVHRRSLTLGLLGLAALGRLAARNTAGGGVIAQDVAERAAAVRSFQNAATQAAADGTAAVQSAFVTQLQKLLLM